MKTVSHSEWLQARKALLAKEKEFTRARDALSAARREMPWERVEKNYVFDGPGGKQTLSELFAGKSQLIIYHFMFHPDWAEGCKSCSFWADNFNGIDIHLAHRDIAFAAISRAPIAKLEAYKKRMGWSFKWLSSFNNDFNFDYGVSFTKDQVAGGATINYGAPNKFGEEIVGVSVFAKGEDGAIYHTYSTYSRGVDILNGAYNYIDLTPKGRDEGGKTQFWVRRHDQYED
ncbi:MAG TPA: thioredoxin family protein [Rhizomicrobium sp.]|nr:thioredoxin family protein [Rhizomicrobium sp.]